MKYFFEILSFFYDYIDIKIAEKRLASDDGIRYALNEIFSDLGV